MVGARAGRRTRGGLVVALAAVLLGLLVPVASAVGTSPTDLPGPYTGITARAWGAVSSVPRQATRAVDGRDGPVTVTGSRSDTWESWTVAFTPREGSAVALNVRGPRVGVGLTGMTASLRFGTTFCAAVIPGHDAPVVVTEYHLDPSTGRPDVLSVDMTGLCQVDYTSDRQQMDVHLRLGASTPYGGLDVPTDVVDLGSPVIGVAGTPVPVPVRYVGSGSVAVASPEVVEETYHPFTYLFRYPVDSCSGRSLRDGDRCSTSVQMRPVGSSMSLPSFVLHGSDGAVIARVPVTWDEAPASTDPVGSVLRMTNRALDTRVPVASSPARQVPAGGVVAVPIGETGSPTPYLAGGTAMLDLTVVAPSAAGYLSVLPGRTATTSTSALNFVAGRTTSNLVLAPIDASGFAYVRNVSQRPLDLIADLEGVVQPRAQPASANAVFSGRLHPVPPSRVLDTRTSVGGARPLPTGDTYLTLRLPTFTYSSMGVLATVTAVSPSTAGWVRVGWPADTSSVNYAAGETTSNSVLGWVGGAQEAGNRLTVTVGGAPVHVVIDVVAVIDDGTSPAGVVVTPLAGGPVRIADSRRGLGLTTLPAGVARSLLVPASLRDQDTWGVMQNLVAIPTRPTSVAAYASGTTRPGTSSVLATTPGPRAATVLTGLSATGSQDLFATAGPTDVVSDVSARVQLFPSTAQLGGFDRIPESLAAIPPATRSR